MSESLEGIRLLIEVGTVTIETGTGMGEVDVAIQYLGITALVLVIVQQIGMDKVHALVNSLPPRLSLTCRLHGKDHDQPYKSEDNEQKSSHLFLLTNYLHVISPTPRIHTHSHGTAG